MLSIHDTMTGKFIILQAGHGNMREHNPDIVKKLIFYEK